jgi:transposase
VLPHASNASPNPVVVLGKEQRMPILADVVDIVIGVDTHKNSHTAAVVKARTGEHLTTTTVPATPAGYRKLIAELADYPGQRCWVIEGCGSWGRGLHIWLTGKGERTVEIDQPRRPTRHMGIKDDPSDALRAAREALGRAHLAEPRADGQRDAVAALTTVRRSAIDAATDAERQLVAIAVTAPEALAGKLRNLSTAKIVATCARWRPTSHSDQPTRTIAQVMRDLAQRSLQLRAEADRHETAITSLVKQWRPDLLATPGVGPIVAATVLSVWSHPRRVRSEAAFAMMAGTAPIPASSGQTTRHRLNRQGDRQLNWAIHIIWLQRQRQDAATAAYIQRRRAQGKTDREIRRCIKRYITRQLYRTLERPLDNS